MAGDAVEDRLLPHLRLLFGGKGVEIDEVYVVGEWDCGYIAFDFVEREGGSDVYRLVPRCAVEGGE